MQNYLDLLQSILDFGSPSKDRTEVGTISTFGETLRFPLQTDEGKPTIPLLTTRQIYPRTFVHETLWFLSGSTDVKYLKDNNVSIWDDWVIPETATFVEVEPEKQTAQNMSTWLRCKAPEAYKVWREHQKALGFPVETKEAIKDVTGVDIPSVALASGSIGEGAYGTAWRNWPDTRLVNADDIHNPKWKQRGYTNMGNLALFPHNYVMQRNIDQIADVIKTLKTNPDSRRMIVTAWNPGLIEDAVLPPCHTVQFYYTREFNYSDLIQRVNERGLLEKCIAYFDDYRKDKPEIPDTYVTKKDALFFEMIVPFCKENNIPLRALSLMLVARSQDFPVGSCANIAQYGMLTHLIAQCVGMEAEEFVWVGSNVHVYNNQIPMMKELLTRVPSEKQPTLVLNPAIKNIDDFKFEDIRIEDYEYQPAIKIPIAV